MVTKEKDAVIKATEDNLQQRQSADPTLHTSHTAQEGSTPIVLEKPLEDGYNWRKYGQKNVKGKEYVRSYYKCSYLNCQVKKQVERSQDGKITDITYLGKHDHAKLHSESQEADPSLLSAQLHTPDFPKSTGDEDKSSNLHPLTDDAKPKEKCELPAVPMPDQTTPVSCRVSNQAKDDENENLISKRRKKGVDGADFTVEKPGHESRHVIRSVSEVDIVNDGYRWRKYGQKMVKGNPNPRSYYRCSTAGCPVKKHVERASHDPKVVITTYEGEHDHTMPPVRTVVPQIAAPSTGGTELNSDGKPKSEESAAVLNGTTCKAERNHIADPKAKEESNATNKVEAKPEVTSSEQDTQDKDRKTNHVEQTSKEPSEKKMEDPICRGLSSDNTNQSSKQEEIAPVNEVKLEDSSMEQQKTDPILESSRHESKSNGQQRMDAEPVNS